MKSLIVFFFPLFTSAQNFTLTDIGDNNLYNHFTPIYTYSNSDNLIIKSNNKLGMFLYYDSINNERLMERFYPTGQVSMIITNLFFKIRENDSTFNYCTTGDVKTFYPNGKLRSYYSLDSMGEIINNVHFFSLEKDKQIVVQVKNGVIYSGIYVDFWDGGYFIRNYKNGICLMQYYFKETKWFLMSDEGGIDKEIRETRKLKKIRIDYLLGEDYALTYPS